MNSYEQKQEARRERLEALADRKRREGQAKFKQGMDAFKAIPFGQPMLVDHYSYKRDRNYRERAGRACDKGIDLQKEAAAIDARAAAVGLGGISSDDPDAIRKLEQKLAELNASQAKMKAANAAMRKGDDAKLGELGYSPEAIVALKTPDCCGRTGYPAYALQNNGANIRRVEARIATLKRNATRATVSREIAGGIRVVENAEANRLQIFFPGKPDADVRAKCKSFGFRWAPSEGAWQRQLSIAAKWAAEQIVGKEAAR